MKKKNVKILSGILLMIYILNIFTGIVSAMDISSAQIKNYGKTDMHLQFWDTKQNAWSYITTTFTGYEHSGKVYPAYCLEVEKPGVGEEESYSVSIDKLLDNVQIWRTVTAGYPYKTPAELGVENEHDAFVATKQAVYSIINNRDVHTFYRGGDAAGDKIFNALNNMVNEGRYGTRTPTSSNVTVNKVGELVKENDYVYQEFSVSSFVNMESFAVTSIAGVPNGYKVTDVNNNERTNFSGNEHFKVQIPISSISDNIDIAVGVVTRCETYSVFYGEAPNNNLQDYAVTFDPLGDVAGVGTFNLDIYKSSLKVIKEDSETKYRIPNVVFNFAYQDGTNLGNYTTDQNGEINLTNLKPGTITATEIVTDENYILNDTPQEIYLSYADSQTISISNERKRGDLEVIKVDKDNNNITLGNVTFDLYSNELNKVIGTYKTDVNGRIFIEDLRVGDYSLIEKETNKWYNLAEDTTLKIEWNNVTNLEVENELKKGQVQVIKVDSEFNQYRLEGVKFEVRDENDKVLETIVTNSEGIALTNKYAIRDYTKLKLVEIETRKEYILNDTPQTVELKENEITSITFENDVKKNKIEVIKVDKENKEYKLEGVTFEIYDEDKLVDIIVTDENGVAITKDLRIDREYKVVETKTLETHILNDSPQTVTLSEDEITSITFENQVKKGKIEIIKVDKENNEYKLEGVTFEIYDNNNNLVDTVITDKDGLATTKDLRVDKEYTIIETKTLSNYVLTEETQKVTLEENQITSITFENQRIKGKLELTKVDSENNEIKLENVKFGIYNENDELIEEIITDKYGIATTDYLYKGKYYVKELETGSPYYLLNTDTFEFEIENDEEVIKLEVTNESVDIRVDIDKKGSLEIQPLDNVIYEFFNIANNSNTYLEGFKWFDYIPTDYIRVKILETGTFNQELDYDIYIKTNKLDEYRLFKENLNSMENNLIDFTQVELQTDEYITEFYFDFGRVEKGFKETVSPVLTCSSLANLQDDSTFTNETKTVGTYFDLTAESKSKWTTIVNIPEKPQPVLPKTGK